MPTKTKSSNVKKVWTHKKYPGKKFEGFYLKAGDDDRIFQLKIVGGKMKPITYDSYQKARSEGKWEGK